MFNYSLAVDKYRDLILECHNYIWKNPETGFREFKTSKYLENIFENLGYELEKAENIPGFHTVIDTGREGPELLILGEMDSLICPEHPDSDKQTGAVHCCGHSAQCAALVGIAAALKEPHALDELSGKIRLCAIPAEEGIEIEYRKALKEKGIINHLTGKSEFLRRGYFDNVDLAFMVHTTFKDNFIVPLGSVGNIKNRIVYKGKSAHAGGSPWNGTNALYAANLGLNAVNALRETFKEEDLIRFHPIITKGGTAVNAIPDIVVIETYLRGKTFNAIKAANKKIDRALIGAALSIGANIEITDIAGSSPLYNNSDMIEIAADALKNSLGFTLIKKEFKTGSTDMGDLSSIMPVIHPYAPGASGIGHGANYRISDPETALIGSAKWQLEMLRLLLSNGAERAKTVLANFEPTFKTKEEFLTFLDTLNCNGERITYNDDTAEIKL